MTLIEIDELIKALENSSLTFNNCQKLASLYICRDHFMKENKNALNKDSGQKYKDFKIV